MTTTALPVVCQQFSSSPLLAARIPSHRVPGITDVEDSAIGFVTVFFAVVSGVAMNTTVVVDEIGRETLVSASEFGRAPTRIVVAYGL
jgi:hypothetical protein